MFIIIWLCIQDPSIPLDKTCITDILYKQSYDTREECREASVEIANKYMKYPNLYITTFCTTKEFSEI